MKNINIQDLSFYCISILAIVMIILCGYQSAKIDKQKEYIKYIQNTYQQLDKEYQDYIDSTYHLVYGDSVN